MENITFFIPLLIPAAIASGVAYYTWRRRAVPGALVLFILMLAVILWLIGYAFELGQAALPVKVFWAKTEYFSITLIPVLLLVFALNYTQNDHFVTTRNLILAFIVPIITLCLVWTNEWHHLIWSSTTLSLVDGDPRLMLTYGPGFWLHTIYAYLVLLTGTVFMVRAFFRSKGVYRKQTFIVLLGTFAPWVGNIIYLSGGNFFNHLDLTPFAFAITGLFYFWGQFNYQFLDLLPVARDALIENMSDAVIVLDAQNRIVDVNRAGQVMIGQTALKIIGQPVAEVLSRQADLVSLYQDTYQTHTEIILEENEVKRLYDLRISPIFDRRNNLAARLIVLRDISERWRAEEAVQKARDELEIRVDERTAEIRAANLRLQQEISERKTTADALLYRLNLEELVTGISTSFINLDPGETDHEIRHALELIGAFTRVDRSYVCLLSENNCEINISNEWDAPGVAARADRFTPQAVALFPWWLGKLKLLEPLYIPTADTLPDEAGAEKKFFDEQNIQSVVAVPMVRSGRLVGFLGLDLLRGSTSKKWLKEDITLLKLVGEIFVSALVRKNSAEQLETSIHEKELLLKEIHHRVKNNLQIISSLLSLQAGMISDPGTVEILRESQTRVRTMAMIHEKLYQSENLAKIDFGSYLENLTGSLLTTYNAQKNGIYLSLAVEKIQLEIDTAVPCGLIINELVSNALKYAYPPGTGGEISIELKRVENQLLFLTVTDHGTGLPADLDFRETLSLGLQLVCSLVDQIDGSINLDRSRGTSFQITFPGRPGQPQLLAIN